MPRDTTEERIRELERRNPPLDDLERRMSSLEQVSSLIRRYPREQIIRIPGTVRVDVRSRCAPHDHLGPWTVRLENPEDPGEVYTEWEAEYIPGSGTEIQYSTPGSSFIARIVMTRPGWTDVDIVEEFRASGTRVRREYSHQPGSVRSIKFETMCRVSGPNPPFQPLPGVVGTVYSGPVGTGHAWFLRMLGSPDDGFIRVKWGDSGTIDVPWNATASEIRTLFSGVLTHDGTDYLIDNTNRDLIFYGPTGATFADGFFPEYWLSLYFKGNLTGVDMTGAVALDDPGNFLDGPNAHYAEVYEADWHPAGGGPAIVPGAEIGTFTSAGDGTASVPTDLLFLDPIMDADLAGDCDIVAGVGWKPYCSVSQVYRFCLGSKSVTIAGAVGDTDFGFRWGTHVSPIGDGPTRTVSVAETTLPAYSPATKVGLISSSCGMVAGKSLFDLGYPQGGQPEITGILTPGQPGSSPVVVDNIVQCFEPNLTWCCEDKAITLGSLPRDGDGSWAGLISQVRNVGMWIPDNDRTPTGVTTRGPLAFGFIGCDCRDITFPGRAFQPRSINFDLNFVWGLCGTGQLQTIGDLEDQYLDYSFSGTLDLTWGGLTTQGAFGPSFVLGYMGNPAMSAFDGPLVVYFPGGGFVNYKITGVGFVVGMNGGVAVYVELSNPITLIPDRLYNLALLGFAGDPWYVSQAGGDCDSHIDGSSSYVKPPYQIGCLLSYNYTATGPA